MGIPKRIQVIYGMLIFGLLIFFTQPLYWILSLFLEFFLIVKGSEY